MENNNSSSKKQLNFSRVGNVKVGPSVEIAHRKIPGEFLVNYLEDLLPSNSNNNNNNYNNNNKPTARNSKRREISAISQKTLDNLNRGTINNSKLLQQQQQQLELLDNSNNCSGGGGANSSSSSIAVKNRNAEKRNRNRNVTHDNEGYDNSVASQCHNSVPCSLNNTDNGTNDNISGNGANGVNSTVTNRSRASPNVAHSTSNKSTTSTRLGEGKPVAGNSIRGAAAAFKQNTRFTPELNSVLSGRRKQNHNHLLNFHYAKLDVFSSYGQRQQQQQHRQHIGNSKHTASHYTKENFLQAKTNFKPSFTASPDTLIKWDAIEQINIETTEEPRCPICLYPPVAAKLTRCGHAYCWPCILHYLALHENMWCKCPICYEVIRMDDLKSTAIFQQKAINVGDSITLQLMHRKKSSLYIEKFTGNSDSMEHFPYLGCNELEEEQQKRFSKFLLARRSDINDIIEREQRELSCGMDDPQSPEFTYVQMALDLLKERRSKLGTINKEYQAPSSPPLVKSNLMNSGLNHGEGMKEEEKPFKGEDDEEEVEKKEEQVVEMSANVKESHYFFYQSIDGQNVYLHPLNIQMLHACYGSLEKSPTMIIGRILQMEHYSMNDYTRRKFTCLAHLPLTRQFAVVEIDLKPPIITKIVYDMFCDEIANRIKERQRRQCEEFKREKKINELNDRQMGKLISSTINLNITSSREFPTWGFDIPLVQEEQEPAAVIASTSSSNKPQASYSAALAVGAKTATYTSTLWPELANNSSVASIGNKVTAGYSGWATSAASSASASNTGPICQRSTISDSLEDLSICGDQKIASTTPTTLSDVLAEAISKRKKNANVNVAAANSTGKTKKGKKKGKGQVFYSNVINYGGKQ